MQSLTPELIAILKSKLQAGPSGWWGKVEVAASFPPSWTEVPGPRRISIDKSFQAQADQAEVQFDNKDGLLSIFGGDGTIAPELRRLRITQGYGDAANGIVTFSGFIDDVAEHREEKYVTVRARDWMKHLLVQDIAIESPQGAEEDGAVRTEDNGVFLNREASYIVDALLDRAFWPDGTRDVRQTSFVFDEFLLSDGESYADALGRVADAVGYDIWATEDEYFHFAPAMRSNAPNTDSGLVFHFDDFDRTVAVGWGTSSDGHDWVSNDGNEPTDLFVANGLGRLKVPTSPFISTYAETSDSSLWASDFDMRCVLHLHLTGAVTGATLAFDFRDALANDDDIELVLKNGTTQLSINTATSPFTFALGGSYNVRVARVGGTLKMKVWLVGDAEPTWQVTDAAVTTAPDDFIVTLNANGSSGYVELGFIRFGASSTDPFEGNDSGDTALWTFRGTEDIYVIDPRKDGYDLKTRVRVVGQITSNTVDSTLEQQWGTGVIQGPTGIGLDPADATKLRILDGGARKVYRISQSTRAIEASTSILGRAGVYCIGLSFDPAASTVFWILDDPGYTGGTGQAKVYKYRRSDNALLSSFLLPAGKHYYDLKVSNTHVWLARKGVSSGTVEKWSKAGAFVAAYTPRLNGDPQFAPVAIGIDYDSGDDLYFVLGSAKLIKADHATPEATTLWAAAPGLFRALEIDPTTNDTVYGATGSLLTAKYLKVDTSSSDQLRLSIEAIDDDLERALGGLAGVERQIRRFTITDTNITNRAQATETAQRWLARLKQYREVLQVGVIANPGIQKGDMIRVIDPPTGIDSDGMVDSYRAEMDISAGTYLGVISSTDWNPVYGVGGAQVPSTKGVWEDFNRTESGQWGGAWENGVTGTFGVSAGEGWMEAADSDVAYQVAPEGPFSAGDFVMSATFRFTAELTWWLVWNRDAGDTPVLKIDSRASGSIQATPGGNVSAQSEVVGTVYNLKVEHRHRGSDIRFRAKAWASGAREPAQWQTSTIVSPDAGSEISDMTVIVEPTPDGIRRLYLGPIAFKVYG